MDQRPHSRNKTVGSGSVNVNKRQQVSTGGPVGSGGSNRGSTARSGGGRAVRGRSGGGKSLLLIIVVVIGIVFLVKNMGGGMSSGGGVTGTEHVNNQDYSYSDSSYTSYASVDRTVSPLAREKRVKLLGNGEDTVTVMVYMCGTDLESKYGMATKDLQEMLSATISDKVNLIVETGGCKSWKNNTVSSSKNQIYKVESGGLRLVEKDMGSSAMTDPANLTAFINYCQKNYPASRNMLIFWDHGGGSLSGYGYDEKYPSSSSMTLSKINSALKNAGCSFDFIGFDACLMATLETALVCENYADYLIASEETEPGTGWYYKNWLTELSQNTSLPTPDIAQTIIDDFVASCRSAQSGAKVTLSLTDLAELNGTIPEAFRSFAAATNKQISSDDYKLISDARAGARQYAQSQKLNQVDLADLAERINSEESNALAKAIHGCVKYNQSTITRSNGLSIYFPYESTKNVSSAVASYQALGIDEEYTKCIKSFASLEYGGQIASSYSQLPQSSTSSGTDLLGTLISSYTSSGTSGSSPLGALLGGTQSAGISSAGYSIDPATIASLLGGFSGRSMPSGYEWVDTELIADNAKSISKNYIDPANIKATQKDGHKVLSLSDEEWGLIQTVELNVFIGDGEGYIDLGLDNTFDWLDDDMLLEYDGTWLTLNGHACAYYLVSDTQISENEWVTVGRIPAKLNGQLVNLQVVFDGEHPEGGITGAYPVYGSGVDVQAKGDIEIKAGDKIELICDYYNTDGSYSASYALDSFVVPEGGFRLENLTVNADSVSYTYRLTDIYGNYFWVPVSE